MSATRPRVLAVIPALFPSTIIGIARPLLRLHLQGRITLDLELQFLVHRRSVERADAIVIGRGLSAPFARVLQWIKESGKPLIHELDDNLVDVPDDIPGLGYARDPVVRGLLIDALSHAAVVRVYSPALQERLSSFNPRVQLATGPLDWTLIPDRPQQQDAARVRVVYATSRIQDRIGAMVVRPLRRALEAFPQMDLTIWGPRLDGLSDHPRVRHLQYMSEYEEFVSRFVNQAFDVGLAPLPDDAFHRCKSNNKFREYASAGVSGLYSDMPVYNRLVVDGETGWLVPDGEAAWFHALERAITSPEQRATIAANARRYAHAHFNETVTDREWMASIDAAMAQPVVATPSRSDRRSSQNGAPSGGMIERATRIGIKALEAVRRDGLVATALRATGPLTAATKLAEWEWRRWRLERRVQLRRTDGRDVLDSRERS